MGSVTEAVRELNKRGILWARPTIVSQQAVSERMSVFPPGLFHKVLLDVLAKMKANWTTCQRPLNAVTALALKHLSVVWILDGSTLDALLRKVGLLRDGKWTVLAGRLGCLLNETSLLPEEVWYEEDSQVHDQHFWERAAAKLPQGGLLLFDLGFITYAWFDALNEQVRFFVTRCKSNTVYQVDQVLGPRRTCMTSLFPML